MIEKADGSARDPEQQADSGIRDEKGRFRPGQSGNPGGRPKGHSILAAFNRLYADEELADLAAKMWHEQILAGSFPHLREAVERQDGKVADQLLHTEVALDVVLDVPEDDIPDAILERANNGNGGNGNGNGSH